MNTTLYGINNCDTVKKARRWLDSQALDYTFHDFRADGIAAKLVHQWAKSVGKDSLINKRSTTWKQLSTSQQKTFDGETLSDDAVQLILDNPTLIKRPVLQHDKQVAVGFKENIYSELLT